MYGKQKCSVNVIKYSSKEGEINIDNMNFKFIFVNNNCIKTRPIDFESLNTLRKSLLLGRNVVDWINIFRNITLYFTFLVKMFSIKTSF